MYSLNAWFENFLFGSDGRFNSGGRVVTVIGSGGKTSLIWRLAAGLSRAAGKKPAAPPAPGVKVLVTPTTKMLVPPQEAKLYDRSFISGELPPCPEPGVTLAGIFNEANGKLESFSPDKLEKLIRGYDLVLIEGDGSRGLPLKAWAESEPVVPSFTDITIGMLPLAPIGKPASESLVHRLPLFTELTGAIPGEPVKPEHILALITGRADRKDATPLPGLFTKAQGKKLLFFNQAEDDGALTLARELVKNLSTELKNSLCGITAGSVRDDWAAELP